MSNTSIVSALADLHAAVEGTAGVAAVYDHEPTKPADKSASIVWTGMDAERFRFDLRIYVKVQDARASQHALYTLIQAVEQKLTVQFSVGEWIVAFNPESQVLMGTLSTVSGREDY